MMKQRITLVFFILINFIALWGNDRASNLLEEKINDTASSCSCDKSRDLAVLKELYDNNGGANWDFNATAGYQDVLNNDGNGGYFDTPNAGVAWDVNAPNAEDLMGTWHGIKTNQQNCVTEIVLWSGAYNHEPFSESEGVGLTGELPASINQLCALERLMIPHNDLTGSIPAGLDLLCNLEVLLLHDNQLEGPLPSEIGNLVKLEHISLHNNAFTGSIPATYTNLIELAIFHAGNNQLTGPIPADIGNLTKLFVLDLSNNLLSGIVPASIVTVGNNSFQNDLINGGLLLNDNELDSLPDLSTISLIDGALFDVSGNHFTFDDIIPNVNVITGYADQTLVLDTVFCISLSDIGIRLQGGFDESIDAFLYGDTSIYIWTRLEDTFTKISGQNFLFFPDISANSTGNFSIEITNVRAPDLTLQVSDFIVIADIPNSRGPVIVCPNTTTPYYVENAESFDWAVSGGGTFVATGDSLYITWGTGLSAVVTATGKTVCKTVTLFNIEILSAFTVSINPPEKLNCNLRTTTLKGTSSDPSTSFSWQNEQGDILNTVDSLIVTTPGTYILVGQNINFCEARDTIVVEEEEAVITSLDLIQGEAAVCDDAPSFLSVVDTFVTYQWNTNNPADTFPELGLLIGVGIHSVTVTAANGCIAVDSVEIEALPSPAINLVQNGVLGCSNDSVLLLNTTTDNNGVLFQWRDDTGALIGTDTFISVNAIGIYSLTLRNGAGCTSIDTIEVLSDTIGYLADAGANQVLTCTTKEVTLDASNSMDALGYQWFHEDSMFIGTGATINVTAAGNYRVEILSNKGCTGSDEVLVTDSSYTLTPPMFTGPPTFCEGTISTLSITDTYASYLWNTGDTLSTIQIDTTGLYSVTVSDAAGCTGSNSVSVTRKPSPVVEIIGPTTICRGEMVTLSTDSTFSNYSWNTGSVTRETLVDTAGLYSLTVFGDNGCSATDSMEVDEFPTLLANIIQDGVLNCDNSEVLLKNDFVGSDHSLEWSNAAGIISSNSFILVTNPGVYILTIQSEFGCTQIDSIEVTADNSLPTANAGSNQFLNCSNNQVILDGSNSIDAVSYSWLDENNLVLGTDMTLTISTAGTYTLEVKNASGCTTTDAVTVESSVDTLLIEFTDISTFCAGENNSLTLKGTYSQYQWSTGETTPSIQVDTAGVYMVNVTDENGCMGSNSIDITINPIPTFEFTGDTVICNEGIATLGVDNTFSTYSWSTGTTQQTAIIDTAGLYSLTVTDANSCSAIDTISIREIPKFTVDITGNRFICTPDAAAALAVEPPNYEYAWSNGGTFYFGVLEEIGIYTLTVTDDNGCTIEEVVEITDYNPDLLLIELSAPSFCTGSTATISVLEPVNVSYEWDTGETTRTITVSDGGQRSVTVTDAQGCTNNTDKLPVQTSGPNLPTGVEYSICVGGTVTLEAPSGFIDYEWETGERNALLDVEAAGNYEVTVTDENGCAASMNIRVREVSLPKPEILGSNFLCEGASTQLTTVNEFDTYEWSTGDTTKTISIDQMAIYSVTVSGGSNGCTSEREGFVVEQAPDIDFEVIGNTAICAGASTTLSTEQEYVKYAWITGDTTATISVEEVGNYFLTVTNSEGCTGISFAQVEERSVLSPQIIGQTIICEGGTTELSADSDYASYLWSTGETTKSIQVDSVSVYTLEVSNEVGCAGKAEKLIREDRDVIVQITGTTSFCEGTTTRLGVANTYLNYSWSNGDTTSFINIDTAGLYQVTVTNENGCTRQSMTMLESQSLPEPIIKGDTILCEGSSTELEVIGDFISYEWDTGNDRDTIPTLTSDVVDTYSVVVTDNNGCTGSTSIQISPAPIVEIKNSIPFCEGDTLTLATEETYNSYFWSSGDTTATITVTMEGTYLLLITDNNGCAGSVEFIVNEEQLPELDIQNGKNMTCFDKSNFLFINNNSVASRYKYNWLKNGENLNISSSFLSVEEPGLYTLQLTDNVTGCRTSDAVELYANKTQLKVEDSLRILDCRNNVALIDARNSLHANYFNWQRTDLNSPNTITESFANKTDTLTARAAGLYMLMGLDTISGCMDTTFIEVRDSVLSFEVSISGEGTICEGDTIELEVNVQENGEENYQYNWSTNSSLASTEISNPGLYYVTVTDENNCMGTDFTLIKGIEKKNLRAELVSDDTEICPGGKATLVFKIINNGDGPYEFTYSTGNSTLVANSEENTKEIQISPEEGQTYQLLKVVDSGNNCYDTTGVDKTPISFTFLEVPKAEEVTSENCLDEGSREASFNLSTLENQVSSDNDVKWYKTENTLESINPDVAYEIPTTTDIYASVVSDDDCESPRVPINLQVLDCSSNLEMVHEAGLDLDLSNYQDESVTNLEVYITNRWGDLVYVANNYSTDAKFTGANLPQGAYYLYMKKTKENDGFVPYKGVIYLLK